MIPESVDSAFKAVVLGLLVGGVAVGLVANAFTIAWRRPDVSIRNILWSGSDIAAHPERYVRAEYVGLVTRVQLFRVCLFLSGVVVIVIKTVGFLW